MRNKLRLLLRRLFVCSRKGHWWVKSTDNGDPPPLSVFNGIGYAIHMYNTKYRCLLCGKKVCGLEHLGRMMIQNAKDMRKAMYG